MKKFTYLFKFLLLEVLFLIFLGSITPLATMGAESFFQHDSRIIVIYNTSLPLLLGMVGFEICMGILFLFLTHKFMTEKRILEMREERLIYCAHMIAVFIYLQTLWMTVVCYLCSPYIAFFFVSESFIFIEKVLILPVWVIVLMYLARKSLPEWYTEKARPSFVTILDAP